MSEKKEKLSVGQEAAKRIEKELGPSWTSLSWRKSASIIDKIVSDRGLEPAGASLPQDQTRAETGGEWWTNDDSYIYVVEPHRLSGIGKCIGRAHDEQDAIEIVNRHNKSKPATDAALPVHKKGDSANQVVENLRGAGYDVVLESETPDSVGDKESNETGVVTEVLEERARQDRKWGEQNHDPFGYLAILVEEVGELAQATLHLRFGGPEAFGVRSELLQVAAVAIAFIECLDRAKWHADSPEWPPVSTPSQTPTATVRKEKENL